MVGSLFLEDFLHLVQVGTFDGEITAIFEGCTDPRSSHINHFDVEVFGLLSTKVSPGSSSSIYKFEWGQDNRRKLLINL